MTSRFHTLQRPTEQLKCNHNHNMQHLDAGLCLPFYCTNRSIACRAVQRLDNVNKVTSTRARIAALPSGLFVMGMGI